MIPYGRQDINELDVQAVVEVLKSDFLTQGPVVPRFESAIAQYCGAAFAVAVNSATSALHIACRALGLSEGDYLWTSPNTFVASANCAFYCGAGVDFVDIDPRTYNISVEALRVKLQKAEKDGRLPKIVISVHFAGQSCEMRQIAELAEKYGFFVVEDASHAIGGSYLNDKVGCCRYSEMTVFSFHPVKIITTGEGGVIVTQREDLHAKLQRLRSHGITRNPEQMTETSHGPWYYQQIDLGYNFRMTDIQAALGYSQMARLDEFIMRRQALAARYDDLLADSPLTTPWRHPDCKSAWHLYVMRLAGRRAEIFKKLRAAGIGVNVHYIPVHIQPYYRALGFGVGDFPEAEKYYEEALTVPLFPAMSEVEQDKVCSLIKESL